MEINVIVSISKQGNYNDQVENYGKKVKGDCKPELKIVIMI